MNILDEIINTSAVPAGGAATAFSAGLAIGLIYKIVLLEIKKGTLPAKNRSSTGRLSKSLRQTDGSIGLAERKIIFIYFF